MGTCSLTDYGKVTRNSKYLTQVMGLGEIFYAKEDSMKRSREIKNKIGSNECKLQNKNSNRKDTHKRKW